MVNDKELADIIAREIFEALDNGSDKCQRIEGKGGRYPGAETKLGGFGEQPLAELIADCLTRNRTY